MKKISANIASGDLPDIHFGIWYLLDSHSSQNYSRKCPLSFLLITIFKINKLSYKDEIQ